MGQSQEGSEKEECHVPVLSGYVKDHKKTEPCKPVPMRPVCGSDEANNTQLSNMLADIVNAISEVMDKEVKTVCRSTEEMINEIEKVDERSDISYWLCYQRMCLLCIHH